MTMILLREIIWIIGIGKESIEVKKKKQATPTPPLAKYPTLRTLYQLHPQEGIGTYATSGASTHNNPSSNILTRFAGKQLQSQ